MIPNNDFKWDDKKVLAFVRFQNQKSRDFTSYYSDLDDFKREYSLKEKANKGWEIISFISCEGFIATLDTKDNLYKYPTHGGWQLDVMLPTMSIHSVKRLSDGQIFCVGDKTGTVGIIKSFAANGSDIAIEIEYNKGQRFFYTNIQSLEKSTPILFTTEDGVDIRESDYVYYVNTMWHIGAVNAGERCLDEDKYRTFFSTEDKAKKYLYLNKPCLSVKEIISIIQSNCDGTYNDSPTEWNFSSIKGEPNLMIEQLKKTVRQKLNADKI